MAGTISEAALPEEAKLCDCFGAAACVCSALVPKISFLYRLQHAFCQLMSLDQNKVSYSQSYGHHHVLFCSLHAILLSDGCMYSLGFKILVAVDFLLQL
jgi:hypothetical protein